MKVSLIATVLNEEKTIDDFLESLFRQSRMPDEVIIADGGSTDKTVYRIKEKVSKTKNYKGQFKILVKEGNRAIGRNEAIKNTGHEIIACADAGCTLDKDWIKNIVQPFEDPKVDVVAGYYKGKPETVFQKCLIPYVLVMEDKLNSSNFLPSSRSMAFKKSTWDKAGKFDEKYSHNEDYVFAHRLKEIGSHIVFEKKAIVNWIPRRTLSEAFRMFFRFAFGDGESGIIRDKAVLIFARYLFGLYFLSLVYLERSLFPLYGVLLGIFFYISWSIKKNYKYVNDKKAFFILPALQAVSDMAVLIGTSLGLIKRLLNRNYGLVIRNNYPLLILLAIYIFTMISVVSSGLPGTAHPFTYQMDEWHQFQAVKDVLKYGSPNLAGSANGTMFNFYITGIILGPLYLIKIIDPFVIKSAMDSFLEQEKLFVIMRLITLFFGILSLITISSIAKMLRLSSFLIIFIFLFNPAWLVISNFFKYDIALTFWITLSFLFFIKYSFSPILKYFLLGCFFSGIAFAVKVSALPLLPIAVVAYFLFTPSFGRKYLQLLLGILIFLFSAIFLGLPDIVFGGRNMYEYLYENIVGSSKVIGNYVLGDSLLNLTFLHKLPAIFGHVLYIFSIFSFFYVLILAVIDFKQNKLSNFKTKIFILTSFLIFSLSFIPLGITISANRSVVLLPFMALIVGLAVKSFLNLFRKRYFMKIIFLIIISTLAFIQIFESYLWVNLKIKPSPQQLSSSWIVKNIAKNSNIGLENIPLYQFEPDFVLKEFYEKQYNPDTKTSYSYSVVDSRSKELPTYLIISNVNFEKKYLKSSPKNELVEKIVNDGYSQIAYFPLTLPWYGYFDNYFYYPYLGLFVYPDGISIFEKKK